MGSGCSKELHEHEAPVPLIRTSVDSEDKDLYEAAQGGSLSSARDTGQKRENLHHGAPMPVDEMDRMATIQSLGVLDTEPERRFDDITKLCCMIFKVPICLVSLVDSERQWFKSVQGLDTRETDRKSSFCAWTLLPATPTVLVVENALEDVRFRNNPLVIGSPHIRFYSGTPLVASDGKRLGSLCIIDKKSRTFDAEACNLLANFGEMVVRELERDKMLQSKMQETAHLSQEKSKLLRAMDCFSEAVMMCNLSLPAWPIIFVNEAWEKMSGLSKDDSVSTGFWSLFKLTGSEESLDKIREEYIGAIKNGSSFNLTVSNKREGLKLLKTVLRFRNATNNVLDNNALLVGIPSILNPSTSSGPCYYYVTVQKDVTSDSSALDFSLINDKIDPFEDVTLGLLLGRGSFGRVYRGQWNQSSVAVKVLEHEPSDSGKMMEALLSSQVAHPNVVQTFKHFTRSLNSGFSSDGACSQKLMETWIIMEFCHKGTLSDAVDRGWFRQKHTLFEVDFEVILLTAKEIASALTYLHDQNIIHGDLTGGNILLGNGDKDKRKFLAKVADFGFSRVLETTCGNIKTKTFGTISHTPPELLLDGTLSKAADVYAFGMILWEMYMGQRPFSGMTQGQIIHHISSRRGITISASCPPPLKKLILSCCNPKYEERPSFSDLLVMLDDLHEELS